MKTVSRTLPPPTRAIPQPLQISERSQRRPRGPHRAEPGHLLSPTADCPAHSADVADLYQAVMASASPSKLQHHSPHSMPAATDGATAPAPSASSISPLDSRSLAQLLLDWQQDKATWRSLTATPSLEGRLEDALARTPDRSLKARIDDQHRRQIGIIDRLFTNLQSKLDIHPQLRPVLAALQIPLARVAILEPEFFLQREHPARQLIDILSQLAIAANFPNQSLQKQLQSLIARIVDAYESDTAVFTEARDTAGALLEQQQRAVSRNTQWLLRTLEGRHKLATARAAVEGALADIVSAKTVPAIILELLDAGWRDLMVLTHVRHGTDSDNWTEALAVIGQLLDWLDRSPVPATQVGPVERELEADNFIEMIEQLLDSTVPAGTHASEVLARLRPMLVGQGKVAHARPWSG